MVETRWLTKEEKKLLRPHAHHYRAMYVYISEATADHLAMLLSACRTCTSANCGWDDYAAAQYLEGEISREISWRNRRDAEAAELALPTAHIMDRLADDGARIHEPQ